VWIETIDIQIKKSRFRKHFFQRNPKAQGPHSKVSSWFECPKDVEVIEAFQIPDLILLVFIDVHWLKTSGARSI
jgi:hypothetical protein